MNVTNNVSGIVYLKPPYTDLTGPPEPERDPGFMLEPPEPSLAQDPTLRKGYLPKQVRDVRIGYRYCPIGVFFEIFDTINWDVWFVRDR